MYTERKKQKGNIEHKWLRQEHSGLVKKNWKKYLTWEAMSFVKFIVLTFSVSSHLVTWSFCHRYIFLYDELTTKNGWSTSGAGGVTSGNLTPLPPYHLSAL